jgi:hypothetical protein
MVFVTSDPHGHRDVLVEALRAADLLDADEAWSGGDQTLWVLGDLLDRGPDGVGVVDLLMRLEQEAPAAGGRVGILLGNHEVLALAMHRFGGGPSDDSRVQSLVLSWERNGGRSEDQLALDPHHVEWLSARPALVKVDDVLLMHSDTAEYLTYGEDVDAINAAITAVLNSGDIDTWWDCIHRLTDRYAFARDGGIGVAEQMMSAFGVRRMVHGHSIIADLRGIEPEATDAALLYARRQVLAIDGGIYAGGPCLVVNLAGWPEP